ncbi:MAG: RNA methyltransferase [Alphaproteobacteria bacterium]
MAGTDFSKPGVRGGPAVVLVRPQLAENIGACARAMLNFGLDEMRLVAPRDGWPQDKARAMASRADEVLDNAALHQTTEAAVADLNLVLATTARGRDMVKPVMTPREAAAACRQAIANGEKVGVLFGAERAGLDNDDVVRAHAIVAVPANPAFASLNLAQAVLLFGYEWFVADPAAPEADAQPPATAAELANFFARLEPALDESGFLFPPEKRPTMVRNIRNIFQRGRLTTHEVSALHGILSALMKLGERPK